MMQEDAEADIQADVSNTLIPNTLTFGSHEKLKQEH